MSEYKNAHQRVIEIQKEIKYIQKDRNAGQSHSAVTHDQVIAALRDSMINEGLVYSISIADREVLPPLTGKAMRLFMGQFDCSVCCADKPEDKISMLVDGHGADSADKGPGKAMSYATKTFFLKLFLIETGDNEESRAPEPTEAPITPHHALKIKDLMAKTDSEEEAILGFLKDRHGAIFSNITELSMGWADMIINMLEQKLAKSNGGDNASS